MSVPLGLQECIESFTDVDRSRLLHRAWRDCLENEALQSFKEGRKCEKEWFKQMCKDKSSKEQTANF